ncbi:hypothetical protein J2S74_000964 [Evansella vedderi]|uniref:Uncharacterized protein n=1 Tax=Evansella vedderi TaxID=38282 RepID=A0ABT9ZQS7_9BACI|nr:hypothetical protein [Evansella vedderi]MDQ0253592.1 hypothetical protein [Evansella vedderi]
MVGKDKFVPGKIDWDQFQNIFKNKGFMGNPFFGSSSKDPQWIEEYIQSVLSQSMPNMDQRGGNPNQHQSQSTNPNQPPPPLQKEVFEGHYNIIVKVLLPHPIHPNQLKIYHAANRIRIDGIESLGPQIIELPVIGKTDGAMSVVKNNILEINIPKELNIQYQEVPLVFE